MNNELIVLTHNDLDMFGCVLNIEYRFPNVKKKYFYTNYADIDQVVYELQIYALQNKSTHILIADVSFSDNKNALRSLYKLGKCTHIDHHMYPDNFWDEFPNMNVVHDKTKSATKLCNEYFGNAGKNKNLDKLTYLIDVYDLWQDTNQHFEFAQDLNEYFWKTDMQSVLSEMISNDFKLPKNFNDVTVSIKHEYESVIQKYEQQNLIKRYGEVSIAFIDDYFNQILIREMKNNQNFVIGVNSRGIIRVRVNQKSPYSESQLNCIRYKLTGNAEYGHLHAFTYKIDGKPTFENLLKHVQLIGSVLNSCTT